MKDDKLLKPNPGDPANQADANSNLIPRTKRPCKITLQGFFILCSPQLCRLFPPVLASRSGHKMTEHKKLSKTIWHLNT